MTPARTGQPYRVARPHTISRMVTLASTPNPIGFGSGSAVRSSFATNSIAQSGPDPNIKRPRDVGLHALGRCRFAVIVGAERSIIGR